MGKRNLLSKRTIILCAFLISGCSDQNNSTQSSLNQDQADLQNMSANDASFSAENAPLLTLQELLGASDVKQAIAEAAATKNIEALTLWQETLMSAAREVNLAANELALIRGEQGLRYLEFQGMKTNYQNAFEYAFVEFEDVNKVYADYPAFENLHKRSMSLVKQRDELVTKVAEELKTSGFEGNTVEEAKRQWQNFFRSQSALQQSEETLPSSPLP
ncbi:MAG: hypothetical protein ACJAVV_001044 [Alphaproteobacteria bacterium]|jgi:hypothetical protein